MQTKIVTQSVFPFISCFVDESQTEIRVYFTDSKLIDGGNAIIKQSLLSLNIDYIEAMFELFDGLILSDLHYEALCEDNAIGALMYIHNIDFYKTIIRNTPINELVKFYVDRTNNHPNGLLEFYHSSLLVEELIKVYANQTGE